MQVRTLAWVIGAVLCMSLMMGIGAGQSAWTFKATPDAVSKPMSAPLISVVLAECPTSQLEQGYAFWMAAHDLASERYQGVTLAFVVAQEYKGQTLYASLCFGYHHDWGQGFLFVWFEGTDDTIYNMSPPKRVTVVVRQVDNKTYKGWLIGEDGEVVIKFTIGCAGNATGMHGTTIAAVVEHPMKKGIAYHGELLAVYREGHWMPYNEVCIGIVPYNLPEWRLLFKRTNIIRWAAVALTS